MSFGLHARAAQPSETCVVHQNFRSLVTKRNSNSDASHSWSITQMDTHPSANAQVTQWRGCYDDICEYRRTEATSNSPEFAKKKRESVVT